MWKSIGKKLGIYGGLVVLIGAMLLNAGGLLIAFQVYKLHHYHQTIQRLQNQEDLENLDRMAFANDYLENPDDRFEWVKAHEFRFQGEMYDIAERQEQGDSTIFFVERDHKEEKAEQVMKAQLNKSRQSAQFPLSTSSPYKQVVKNILTQLFIEGQLQLPSPQFSPKTYFTILSDHENREEQPPTPPPCMIA